MICLFAAQFPGQFVATHSALLRVEALGQVAIERVVNSLPEGMMIAAFAWAVLRLLPKQNSRTRFAVWFVALLAVVGIAGFGGVVLKGFGGISGETGLSSHRFSAVNLPAHWALHLFVIWLVAATIAIIRLAVGVFHLRNLRHTCTPLDASEFDPTLQQTLLELNRHKSFAARPVRLATSERLRVPAALGLWQPTIVLPTWTLRELPPSDLAIILRHEFAHLRRWDDWTNLVQKIVRAIFFFHPAVWWIEKRLSIEREMACDDVVVAETDNPMGYATCLVSLLERSLAERGWTMAQAIVHRAREASHRLALILDKDRPTATGISTPALGLVGTFAVLCLALLPATPHFIAFEQPSTPASANHTSTIPAFANHDSYALVQPAAFHAAGLQQSALESSTSAAQSSAIVIPAELKVDATKSNAARRSPLQKAKAEDKFVQARRDVVVPNPASRSARAAQAVIEANSRLPDPIFPPSLPNFIIVQQAHFVTAEFPIAQLTVVATPRGPALQWNVQMMRVTFVAPTGRERTHLPAANKI